jgi:hypothetical protein
MMKRATLIDTQDTLAISENGEVGLPACSLLAEYALYAARNRLQDAIYFELGRREPVHPPRFPVFFARWGRALQFS